VVRQKGEKVLDTVGQIRRSQEGDKQAREQLITENFGLVWSLVRRFTGRGCEAEDLFQIGVIGLIKAIDHFDLNFDVRFSTYAVPMITGEIKRFLRDDGMLKVSRSLKENNAKIKSAQLLLADRLGREPTLLELEEETGLSREDIVLAQEACNEVESLSKPVYFKDGSEGTLAERIGGGENESEQIVNHLMMKQLLSELTGEEKSFILQRYFKNKTQAQIAGILGVSQVQVSRMEKRILARMREMIEK